MAPLLQSAKNMKGSSKGTGTIVFALLFLLPFMIFSIFLIERQYLISLKNTADDAVVGACLAALKSTDPIELAYGEYVLNKSEAENVFYHHLRKNLKLDGDLNPQSGSIALTPVEVEEFIIYNPGEYPTTCPKGIPVTNTTIHTVVSFQVKRPGLRGMFGDKADIRIHRDVDNLYFLKNED